MTNNSLKEQSFIHHLIELRDRFIRAGIGVLLVFICLVYFSNDIYNFVATPLLKVIPEGGKMIATDVIAPFIVPIKLTLWVSFFIAIPWVLYQVWSFVAPGLYQHEKKVAYPIIASSVLLFYLGMAFAYYAVMPVMFKFLSSSAPSGVEIATDISKYLSTVLRLFFFFGIVFEIPIVLIILISLRIISTESLIKKRPYIIIGVFTFSAIATPPDPFSMIIFATAALLLFELGLYIGKRIEKNRAKKEANNETDDDTNENSNYSVEASESEKQ
ncbi:twin-arginine translocase subunit TatC [Ignatzschineria sp. LJL83]